MLPLQHFFGGKLEPNSGFESDPKSISWEGDCGTGTSDIRGKMSNKERLVESKENTRECAV